MLGRLLSRFALACLGFYRRYISSMLPPLCRYEPTCSAYMQEAIKRKGFIKGLAMGCWRLCRCHPFATGGWDPVDPADQPRYLQPEPEETPEKEENRNNNG